MESGSKTAGVSFSSASATDDRQNDVFDEFSQLGCAWLHAQSFSATRQPLRPSLANECCDLSENGRTDRSYGAQEILIFFVAA